MSRASSRLTYLATALALALAPAHATAQRADAEPLPSIEASTAGMEFMDGLLPLYWNADSGRLWM